jgi:hypothetical protein
MKILKCILFCMLLAGVSCLNDVPDSIIPLEGTKWKLAGAVNVATGELKDFEPKTCVECFTLTFNTDSTAVGLSVLNDLEIHLLPKPAIVSMTKVGDNEIGDAQSYYDAWLTMTSYKIVNDDLWFLFNNDTEYLLFKQLPTEMGEPDMTIENRTGRLHYYDEIKMWGIEYGYPGSIDSVDIYLIKEGKDYFEEGKEVTVSGFCYRTEGPLPAIGGLTYYYIVITNLTFATPG